MGKHSRKEVETSEISSNGVSKTKKPNLWSAKAVDPSLALLFSSSAGPVQAPPTSRYTEPPPPRKQHVEIESEAEDDSDAEAEDSEIDEDLSSVDEDLEDADLDGLSENEEESDDETQLERLLEAAQKPERKRKRKDQDEDLEGKYMQKLVEAEEKEEAERQAERRVKRQRIAATQEAGSDKEDEDEGQNEDEETEIKSGADEESDDETKPAMRIAPSDVPLHESLIPDNDASELEKAARTIFLANVCSSAITSKSANKTLLAHLSSFLESLPTPPEGKPAHKVESFRFRSTAFATPSLPKKAAFAKKDIRVATTKSTNAYVVYSTAYAAREAVKKLNGTVVLDRHLRVDGVAHPAKTDHKRCVFVGNLGFVDDESMVDANGENERKRSKIPSDIEEGLWRQFGKAGTVESVRVVRDEKTRVGKGFAYVQFEDPNSVEAALLFHDKKYPPMLPRILRVVRAKPAKKTALAFAASRDSSKKNQPTDKNRIYNPKITSEASSLHGRAGRMLGKAGAAKLRNKEGSGANTMPVGVRGITGIAKTPEKIIFEGHRALRTGKPKDLKSKKGSGKPKTKGSKRAASWKKSGGKK